MAKKKVLITGSAGFVGKNLYRVLSEDFEAIRLDKNRGDFTDEAVDITDEKEFKRILDLVSPDTIVHAAAYASADACETNKELAYKTNVLAVKNLVEWAKVNSVRVIFISSDYVYDGVKGNFTEEDPENPLQFYGKTKLEGEKLISSLKNYVILRPTVIYGWDPGGMNFFMQLYRNQMAAREMKVPVDQISNPTFVLDLCELIKKIMRAPNKSGKYIATGEESMSRYEFALKICAYMGWDKDLVIPVKTSEMGQIAKRPLNNSTSSKKVCETFGFKFNEIYYNLGLIKKSLDSVENET